MTEIADDLLVRLAKLETGQVSDVLDEAGLANHALSSDLVPLAAGSRFAGIAVCARGEAAVDGRHARPAMPGSALEQAMRPGGVLVIDSGGFRRGALLGGFVAYSLQREGCVAIVTDGPVRDADEIRGLGLAVVAGAVTPVNGSRRWRWTDVGVPVTLPGQEGRPVAIAPGDYILADGDGVVVVPAAAAATVIADAEELARIEGRIGEGLRAGGTRAEVFKANPRFDHVRPAGPRPT